MPLGVEILADQISRAFRGESWHGPSVREVLAGVSAADAAAHPIAGAHSIWKIVLYLTAGYIVLGVHPVLRRASVRPVPCGPDRSSQEGTLGVARGGLTTA